jgi:hypothetical protein
MGLFDSYFDPQTYSGGSGLIDRLLAQLGPQSPQNLALSPDMQPANFNAQQGQQPVGYQGQPNPAYAQMQQPVAQTAPRNVVMQADQPQAQPQQPNLPPQLQPQGNGVGDHFIAGLQNFAHGGSLLGAIAGGITGLATGERMDPQGVNAQNLRTQYQALLAAGVPPQKALLATVNPEAGKAIITEAFGRDKYSVVQTGENGLGQKQYEVFNPATGEHKPINPQAGTDSGGGLGNMDLTGPAYLASLPKAQANTVQMMVEGKMAPPSSFALSKPYWQNMMAAAKNYDPTFDATNWSGRVAGVKDFSAGKSSEMVRSANQTLHHVGSMLNDMDALNNGSYPLLNRAANAIAEATGSGVQGSFGTNAHAVAEELSKVFKGSNLSDAEIHAWEQNLSENMSPEQQRAQVAKLRDLLQGSLQALEEKRLNSMGPMAAEKAGPLVKEEGQRVLQRIDDWTRKGTGAAQGSSPAQTKTGVSWSVVK